MREMEEAGAGQRGSGGAGHGGRGKSRRKGFRRKGRGIWMEGEGSVEQEKEGRKGTGDQGRTCGC